MTRARKTAVALALGAALEASAVSLGVDGLGQALIYPYYTVRTSEGGNAFNTYVSVVNHTSDAKAVRVRVREGRAAKAVLDFNLYLSPNDVWAAAIVPTTDGTRILTTDTSCTDSVFATGSGSSSLDFRNNLYSGSNADGFGDTLDRTREGYVEMIEMATLTGASRTAITHNSAGVPANCAAIRGPDAPSVARPTGGLSGTLTLINVANGMDFTVNADALADLSSRQFFRPATDPYPDFAAAEIDNVSVVTANNHLYRSTWTRPVDAVSAVLMRETWIGEYVLDTGTASQTDLVSTLPTRHHYTSATSASPPFSQPGVWSPGCNATSGTDGQGERIEASFFNREERGAISSGPSPQLPPFPGDRLCAAAGVASINNNLPSIPPGTPPTLVLGSTTKGAFGQLREGYLTVASGFQNGWIQARPTGVTSIASPAGTLTSLPGSTRMDLATGTITSGAHVFTGLPVLGFAVRNFRNGTLACTSGACQGNYGGAFPFKYTRRITPP